MEDEEILNILEPPANKLKELKENFNRNLLLTASGIMSLTVSLHKMHEMDSNARTFYSLGILSLSAAILLLTFALFGLVQRQESAYTDIVHKIQRRIRGESDDEDNLLPIYMGGRYKVFDRAAEIGYISFCLGVIGLAVYAVLIA